MNHTVESLKGFEADVAAKFNAGEIHAPIHLSGGNEQQLIDTFKHIKREDWIFSTWRSHYHALLHGVPPELVMEEIMAGRSIALCFPGYRFFSSAIVGGNLQIALGVALGIKRAGGKQRVHAFCGDMTSMAGAFHESFTYAARQDLPIRFVVEDNGLSVCTPTQEAWGMNAHGGEAVQYQYKLPWPHSGAGKRIQF